MGSVRLMPPWQSLARHRHLSIEVEAFQISAACLDLLIRPPSLVFLEVVLVELVDLILPSNACPDAVLDHKIDQHFSIDQYHL